MKEFIDKLIEKIVNTPTKCLEEYSINSPDIVTGIKNGIEYGCASRQNEIIDIVNELAEEFGTDINVVSNGWITDRVPTKEECGNYGKEFLTTIPQGDKYKTIAMRYEYTKIRGKEVSRWTRCGRIAPWEPIAWCELPAPYTEGE